MVNPTNPNLFYGIRPVQLNRRIRNKLSGRIIPSTMTDEPLAPNSLLDAEGPDESLAIAG